PQGVADRDRGRCIGVSLAGVVVHRRASRRTSAAPPTAAVARTSTVVRTAARAAVTTVWTSAGESQEGTRPEPRRQVEPPERILERAQRPAADAEAEPGRPVGAGGAQIVDEAVPAAEVQERGDRGRE